MRPFHPEDIYRMRYVSDPRITPDGSTVAYTVTVTDPEANKTWTQIYAMPAAGGSARQLTSSGSNSQPRWSPDGRTLAFVSDRSGKSQIHLLPFSGGEAVQLTSLTTGARFPAWSPDGTELAFLSNDVPFEQLVEPLAEESPLARALSGSKRTYPAADVRVTANIKYKADTRGLFPKDPSIFVASSTGATPQRIPARVVEGVLPVWSSDGRYLAFAGPTTSELEALLVHNVMLWDREQPERVHLLWGAPGPVKMMAWAPDGLALAVVTYDRQEGAAAHFHLHRLDLMTGQEGPVVNTAPHKLTSGFPVSVSNEVRGDSRVAPPAVLTWSPDGDWLYFVASDRGCAHLFRVAARPQANVPVERVTPDNRWVVAGFSFARDGSAVLQIGDSTRLDEIYSFSLTGGGEPRRITDENGAFLSEVHLAEPVQMMFKAEDGLEIEGWLLEPHGRKADDEGRWPMILNIHGGPHGCWGWTFHTEFQSLAAQGYAVLYINPRGSHSYSPEFTAGCVKDWGGKDYGDLMTGVDTALERFPWIDPERLGVTGNSYGGFMTSWIVGSTDRFKAAVTQGVVSNQLSMYGTSDIGYFFNSGELGADPWSPEGIQEMIKRSPVFLSQNVTCPVLVIHAEEDHRCPIGQGEEIFTALKAAGKTAAFVRYPGEDHLVSSKGKPRNRVDRLFRVVDWFQSFVPAGTK